MSSEQSKAVPGMVAYETVRLLCWNAKQCPTDYHTEHSHLCLRNLGTTHYKLHLPCFAVPHLQKTTSRSWEMFPDRTKRWTIKPWLITERCTIPSNDTFYIIFLLGRHFFERLLVTCTPDVLRLL